MNPRRSKLALVERQIDGSTDISNHERRLLRGYRLAPVEVQEMLDRLVHEYVEPCQPPKLVSA